MWNPSKFQYVCVLGQFVHRCKGLSCCKTHALKHTEKLATAEEWVDSLCAPTLPNISKAVGNHGTAVPNPFSCIISVLLRDFPNFI